MQIARITIVILLLLLVCSSPAFADIMPDGYHSVQRCVKIINLNQFPDMVLAAYVIWPPGITSFAYLIEVGKCLNAGYKFSKLKIYVTTPKRAKALGLEDLETLKQDPWRAEKVDLPNDLTLITDEINAHDGTVVDHDPLTREVLEYSLTKMADGSLSLYKSKQISSYKDGRPDHVESFPAPHASLPGTEAQAGPADCPPTRALPAPDEEEGRKFLKALLMTLGIEVPLVYGLVRRFDGRSSPRLSQIVLVSCFATIATLPYLWFVLPPVFPNRHLLALFGESSVIAGETVVYWQLLRTPFGLASAISCVANVVSYLMGELIAF
jgi:hypothetical protein